MDTSIRERVHLTRISDAAAEFFYALYLQGHKFFQGRITRNTPRTAIESLLSNGPLRTSFQGMLFCDDGSMQGNTTKMQCNDGRNAFLKSFENDQLLLFKTILQQFICLQPYTTDCAEW